MRDTEGLWIIDFLWLICYVTFFGFIGYMFYDVLALIF